MEAKVQKKKQGNALSIHDNLHEKQFHPMQPLPFKTRIIGGIPIDTFHAKKVINQSCDKTNHRIGYKYMHE